MMQLKKCVDFLRKTMLHQKILLFTNSLIVFR